jgi:CelD/BcsL family acetyltransferase involved in cellulose biosynthesis
MAPSVIPPEEALAPGLREEWAALLDAYPRPNNLHPSPPWIEHKLEAGERDCISLLGCRGPGGELQALVPLARGTWALDYGLKLRTFWKTRLRCAHVLGSQLLAPPDADLYDRLFDALHVHCADADCVLLRCVPTSSFLWKYLNESRLIRQRFLLYTPDGPSWNHCATIPGSFGEYLSRFNSKKRYNLKRQVKLLREHGGGRLELRRVEQPGDVPAFLGAAAQIASRSWQGAAAVEDVIACDARWSGMLTDLAQRDLLRCYLLTSGDTPCAFVLGYQLGGTYHYAQIGYDQQFAAFSPGTVLLYLLVEDLTAYRKASLLHFGFGDTPYKREFGDVRSHDALVLLLRATFRNRVRRAGHSLFRRGVALLKAAARGGSRLAGTLKGLTGASGGGRARVEGASGALRPS